MYDVFAYFYDELMSDLPYDKWADTAALILEKHGIKTGRVIDLGCGTGEITMRLFDKGYEMTGIDLSSEMLTIAADKKYENEMDDIMYVCQDMTDISLPFKADAFVCLGDGMNYLTDEDTFTSALKSVKENISDNGVFVFDLKTYKLYSEQYADNEFSEEHDDVLLNWVNHFDKETGINTYNISLEYEDEDGYQKSDEIHEQKAYSTDVVHTMAEQAGLKIVEIIPERDKSDISEAAACETENADRLYYVLAKA